MAMLELFLPLAMNAHPSQVPNLSGHYRLLLLVGQFGELTSHGQVTNVAIESAISALADWRQRQ